MKRAIALAAFAFLLLSQQLGLAHAISHLSTRAESGSVQKKSLPPELQCEQCLHFSALGSGLPGAPPALVLHDLTNALAASPEQPVFLPTTTRAFDSRAPPVSF